MPKHKMRNLSISIVGCGSPTFQKFMNASLLPSLFVEHSEGTLQISEGTLQISEDKSEVLQKSEGKSEGSQTTVKTIIKVKGKVKGTPVYLESGPIWYQNGPVLGPTWRCKVGYGKGSPITTPIGEEFH